MNLHTLYASCSNITNKGIKHMKLHTLNASGNKKITDVSFMKNLKIIV